MPWKSTEENTMFMDIRFPFRHGAEMPYEENVMRFIRDKVNELGGPDPFSEKIGMTDRVVNYWLTGGRVPGRNAVRKMAASFGVSVDDIIYYKDEARPPEAASLEPLDFVPIPYLEQEALGGSSGMDAVGKRVKSYLAFSSPWIFSKGNPNNMFIMRVRGSSMSNVIPAGAVVLFDESWRDLENGKIYVVAHNGAFKVKRVVRQDEGIYLHSDDNVTEPELVRVDDYFQIMGRALWYGMEIA
jgi:phage repressor protein C with HTH and peptisase S24 domain